MTIKAIKNGFDKYVRLSTLSDFKTQCKGTATERCVTGEAVDTEIHGTRPGPETDPHGYGQGQVGGGQRRLPRVSCGQRRPQTGPDLWGGGPRYHGYHELSPEKLSGLCPLMAKKRHIGIPAGPLGSGTHTDLPHSASTASCSSGTGVVPPWKGRQRVSVSCGVASTSPSLQQGALSWGWGRHIGLGWNILGRKALRSAGEKVTWPKLPVTVLRVTCKSASLVPGT